MLSSAGLSGSTQSLVAANRRATLKAPAPPPPQSHRDATSWASSSTQRKISDPGFDATHRRTPSDPPPPLPAKIGASKANLPGEYCPCNRPTRLSTARFQYHVSVPSGH